MMKFNMMIGIVGNIFCCRTLSQPLKKAREKILFNLDLDDSSNYINPNPENKSSEMKN